MRFYSTSGRLIETPDARCRWGVRIALLILTALLLINLDIIALEPIHKEEIRGPHKHSMGIDSMSLIQSMPLSLEYGNISIDYVPLAADCKPPTALHQQLPASVNLCWYTGIKDIKQRSKEVVCAPRVMIIGVAGCGTTDLTELLQVTKTVTYGSDFQMTHARCAVQQAESNWRLGLRNKKDLQELAKREQSILSHLPTLIFETQNHGFKVHNKTKRLQVRSALQHLQVVTTTKTRYVLMLRDPVERAISQLFYWKEQRALKDTRDRPLNQQYLHTKVSEQIERLNGCFRMYGPRACIYMTDSKQGNIDTLLLWGMYVEYIEEALRFIHRDQLLIVKLENYNYNKYNSVSKIFKFLNLTMGYNYYNFSGLERSEVRTARTIEPSKITTNLLMAFYRPFNQRLIKLLGSRKWCFSSC